MLQLHIVSKLKSIEKNKVPSSIALLCNTADVKLTSGWTGRAEYESRVVQSLPIERATKGLEGTRRCFRSGSNRIRLLSISPFRHGRSRGRTDFFSVSIRARSTNRWSGFEATGELKPPLRGGSVFSSRYIHRPAPFSLSFELPSRHTWREWTACFPFTITPFFGFFPLFFLLLHVRVEEIFTPLIS